ncbi:MAG: methylamine utilization protein [Bacteroidales bacterium]|nr:methylamine utilization protein [Bacteroidales bacterium]
MKSVSILFSASFYFLIAILLFSGISKVLDPRPMLETIKAVINVREELQIAAATLLPVLEITLGVMLLLRIRVKETLIAVTILFLLFFLFSVYGTVIGLENDCGCFGNAVDSSFGIGMVIRNFLFLSLALLMLIKIENKSPGRGKTNKNKKREDL